MKITFEFKSEEEYETFRKILANGTAEMMKKRSQKEPDAFEVYSRVLDQMVKK